MFARKFALVLSFCMAHAGVLSAAESEVTVLSPGFSARELPLKLSNINNLRFAPDGTLTALGYDGRVWLLRDTNKDGLEDSATPFWDKQTLSVPVGMVWARDGLVVSSHGKVSLLRDTDRDGRADSEEILAEGWPVTDVATGGVDATSVTTDTEGNVYFGLLTPDYSNPYRVKDGVSRYNLNDRRGTIQKWNSRTRALETIATGIRVPYALAFNRLGDLFLTDQEGETWCPNGNPLDELNHIIPGRNYGFPPRHEKWLPDLMSEVPVVGFGPQHQSACGFVFNEPSPKRRRFGPDWWAGDAFVAGESRGKIWRVKMEKTSSGYVGQDSIFARISMLTTDLSISPAGELYVSCHSGKPDWGTGPNGEGKIFKITHSDLRAPQPVAVWASGLMEVSVAFDRAIDSAVTNQTGKMVIEFGEFVSAADRLEVLKPPYQVVTRQEATPRGRLTVVAARLSNDGRTLTLATDPHPQSVRYALTIPGVRARGAAPVAASAVDVDYSLSGVEAKWLARGQRTGSWSGWLPHFDSQINESFLAQSTEHKRLWNFLHRPGRLEMRSSLQLPGSTNTLRISANTPFEFSAGTTASVRSALKDGKHVVEAVVVPSGTTVPVSISAVTSAKVPEIHVSCSSELNSEMRPLPFGTIRLPWAPPLTPVSTEQGTKTELAGGDYERGRDLFFGEKLKCSTCHRIRAEGALTGPDLSNLVHKDAASVLRDIKEPSASIHPDYVAYNVARKDGEDVTGFVRAQGADALRIVAADGREQRIPRGELKELRPSSVSLMPTGLLDGLNDLQVRDLLTFLLHEPPSRTRADADAIVKQGGIAETVASSPSTNPQRPLNIVLVASKRDHGPGQHDYPRWQTNWTSLLRSAPKVTVTTAWEWPSAEQFAKADLIVCYFWNHNWSAERYQQLDEYLARGGGLGIFHSATIADKEPEKLAARIGLAAQPGPTKYLHAPMTLQFTAPTNHPITRGFSELYLIDEPYWPMFGDTNRVNILATTIQEGSPRPMIWTYERGKGRVFASIVGHYTWTLDDPVFRLLALRGLAWAGNALPSRFE